jgi:hypothetical protein
MSNGIYGDPATFVAPPVSKTAFLALLSGLVLAQQTAAETRARGAAKARDVKRNPVWTAMVTLRDYVQGLCDVMDPDSGAALIEHAGLLLGAAPGHLKALLTAALTAVPGVVHLDANATLLAGRAAASKRLMFEWQWSSDGSSWHDARSTTYARTDVPGLALMTTYSFRVRVTVGTVTGPWSSPVSLLVH